jgi:hypothetical protein
MEPLEPEGWRERSAILDQMNRLLAEWGKKSGPKSKRGNSGWQVRGAHPEFLRFVIPSAARSFAK